MQKMSRYLVLFNDYTLLSSIEAVVLPFHRNEEKV
jgi:hypothetical protein